MALLPPYGDSGLLDPSTSWSNNLAAQGANAKFGFNDDFAAAFGTVAHATNTNSYQYNYLESPTLPPAQVFDTGLPHNGQPTNNGVTVAPMPVAHGAAMSSTHLASNLQRIADSANDDGNALQLDTASLATPTGSPRTNPSSYPSPSFQLSPTPGLTLCPTVDSTPGPRSHSRCSSHSSFSAMSGVASGFNSVIQTPATSSTTSPIMPLRTSLGGGGRKNSAVANGTFKPKKDHLCPYEICERHTLTFRSNADLQRHVRSHRGLRPHVCPAKDCPKAYGQQNKLVKHVESIHPHLLPLVEMGRTRTRRKAAVAATATATQRNVRRVATAVNTGATALMGNKAMGSSLAYHSYPSTPTMSPQVQHSAPTSAGSLGGYHHASPLGSMHTHSHTLANAYNRPQSYPTRSGPTLHHQLTRTPSNGSGSLTANPSLSVGGLAFPPNFSAQFGSGGFWQT